MNSENSMLLRKYLYRRIKMESKKLMANFALKVMKNEEQNQYIPPSLHLEIIHVLSDEQAKKPCTNQYVYKL